MLRRIPLCLATIGLMLIASTFGAPAAAAKESENEQRERVMKATTVLSEIMQIPEGGIPDELMSRAEAIAVFPHVVKGAFVLGGEYGKGLISHRGSNGKWSPPAYTSIGGGSVGFQIGVEAADLVLVFTNQEGVKGLLKGKVKLGVDAGATGGPVGRKAQVATDVLLKSPILSYSRSKGLFAGISLDGAVISVDDSADRKAYGKEASAEDILLNNKVRANETVAPFIRVLEKYAPQKNRATD